MSQLAAYFARPFPRAEGFSAYRMPGAAVHAPVMAGTTAIGYLLCRHSPSWPAPLTIYVIAGLYIGRDLAILAHYNGLIALAVWIGGAMLLFDTHGVSAWIRSLTIAVPVAPIVVPTIVLVGFLAHVVTLTVGWPGQRRSR